MALVSLEPSELEATGPTASRYRACRTASGRGVGWWLHVMASVLADNEHQSLGLNLVIAFKDALDWQELVQIFAGCNVSDQAQHWKHNYRCPDVAVFLPGNSAEDRKTHW